MIRAYHWVPKEAFPEIQASGQLTPAIERLNPEIFREKCAEMIESLGYAIGDINNADQIARSALDRLIADRIQDLEEWSPGSETFTQLGCIDLLAMDHENVFLQVGRWPHWAGQRPTGFIFDAEALVRQGAIFRKKDLAPAYWAALQKFMLRKFDDIDHAEDTLVSIFADIQRKNDLEGKAALKALGKRHGGYPPELIWAGGGLPIALAIDWLYEGETVRV